MSNESSVLLVTTPGTDKRITGSVALVDSTGANIPAVGLPALPTADGNYQLTVASGVLSWTEIV